MYDSRMPEELRPPWPENSEPSPGVWVDWFSELTYPWQKFVAEQLLTRTRHDTRCFQLDHLGQIEDMRTEITRLRRLTTVSDKTRNDPYAWLGWFDQLDAEERKITAAAIINNSLTAHQCRGEAHGRWLRQLREALVSVEEIVRKGLQQ